MKILAALFVLLFPFLAISQKEPIKWKEIPMEDLQMATYELDPNAPAVVLCDYGQIYFSTTPNGQNLFVIYDRHVRIKILKPEGSKYAKLRLSFHNMACEQLQGENSIVIKAMVYNLSEKGEIVATKVKNKDIIYKDSTDCLRTAEITFPDVKPGSIIEYSYQKPSLDFMQPESWYFQSEIPVRHSELRMRVPRAFQYMFSSPNIPDFDVSEETDYNSSVMFTPRGYRTIHVDVSGKQMRFVKNNIEAFNSHEFITRPEDFMQKLNIHLTYAKQENSDYAWKYLTYQLMITTDDDYDTYEPVQRTSLSYPSGYIIYKLPDWEKLNKDLMKSDRFGLPLINFWEYQEPLNQMISGKITPKDQMIAIYDYLRKNMKWTGEYSLKVKSVFNPGLSKIYTKLTKKLIKEKSLARPFQDKKGTSSEINFLLIYLLNKAGIETYPIIISTRNHGQIDTNIVDTKQFNHVLALVKIGDRQFLLDAIDSLRPYNILNENDLNSIGFMVKGKDFGWIPISNNKMTETKIQENITIDSNLNLSDKKVIYETGYDALNHRKEIIIKGKEKFMDECKIKMMDLAFDKQIEIKNIENDTLPLIINSSLMKKSENGKEIKFQIHIEPTYGTNDFSEFDRKYPVDFTYPFQKNYVMELAFPDNYIVELPSNESYSSFGSNAFFQYLVNKSKNKIIIKINLQILKSKFPESEYLNLGELFTKLNDKLTETIVIKKPQ